MADGTGGDSGTRWLRTPDHRVRVFVSSTLEELAAEREAARAAIEQLRLAPVMFELAARSHPPRVLYRTYLAQSDVFVGVYWQRYGWVAPDMSVSGLEDEYDLSDALPRLIYVRRPAPDREPRLAELLDRIRAAATTSYRPFGSAEELRGLVADDLAILLTEAFATAVDPPGRHPVATRLPASPTPLVGRGALVDELRARVEGATRLITLTGPGGIGKTRVALAAAARVADSGTDVVHVDLVAVPDGNEIAPAVAAALDVAPEGSEGPREAVIRRIGTRRLLLVLDNLEHVAATDDVAELLRCCPRLQVLGTGRRPLRLRGELEWPVGPLDGAAAHDLLVARMRDHHVWRSDVGVHALLDRLDGHPLAIELAAAQLRVFSPGDLLERLDDRLARPATHADVPARQRTLVATVDDSLERLDAPARSLFGRLAVCSGAFDLTMAEAVADADVDVPEALAGLLEHGLVTPAVAVSGPAFRMLEPIRAVARQALASDLGEWTMAHDRLADHLVMVLAAAADDLFGAGQADAVRLLDERAGDLATALTWRRGRRSLGSLVVALAACWVWVQVRGPRAGLDELPDPDAAVAWSPLERGALMLLLAGRRFASGQFAEVVAFLEPRMGTLRGGAYGAMNLTLLAVSRPVGQFGRACAELEEAVRDLDEVSGPMRGYALTHLGDVRLAIGDVAGARAAHQEALALAARVGDRNLLAECHTNLAMVAVEEGDAPTARSQLAVAGDHYRALDHQDGLARCDAAWGAVHHLEGDTDAARAALLASGERREAVGVAAWPPVAAWEARWEHDVMTGGGARAE